MPYEERQLATSEGARYVTGHGWFYTGPRLPSPLQPYVPHRYSWEEWRQRALRGELATRPPAPEMSTGEITLRPDQREDATLVLYARSNHLPEFVLANDVGTGKTVTTIAAVKAMAKVLNVLVVCPLPVAPTWRRHLKRMGDGGKNWCVINYESTKKLLEPPASARDAKRTRTKNLRTVRNGTPRVHWDVVITDESHALGNPESQQTMAMDRVVNGIAKDRPVYALRLSATAGAEPSKLSYLHRGLAWRTGSSPKPMITADDYVAWCQPLGIKVDRSGYGNRLRWERNDADLKKMHTLLFRGAPAWGTRRQPPWDDPQRIPMPIALSPAEQAAYQTEWARFRDAMNHLDHLERTLAGGKDQAPTREARDRGRAAQMRYSQKAGQIKARSVAAFALTLLDKGLQVAISCRFIPPVDIIQSTLAEAGVEVATFTGQNRDTREAERLAFQRGEKRVIVFTPTEGFDLHAGDHGVPGASNAPRATILAEPRWGPIPMLQVEGRAHRDWQLAPVYYAYAEGTADQPMMENVVKGMKDAKAMMGDPTIPFAGLAEALGVPRILSDREGA